MRVIFSLPNDLMTKLIIGRFGLKNTNGLSIQKKQIISLKMPFQNAFFDGGRGDTRKIVLPRDDLPAKRAKHLINFHSC